MSWWKKILDEMVEQWRKEKENAQTIENKVDETPSHFVTQSIERPQIRFLPHEGYFDYCHNYIFNSAATTYLLKVGLYVYIDTLQIGYDPQEQEIILPLSDRKYLSIKLKFDKAADEEEESRVLQNYNLKPNEHKQWRLYKGRRQKVD